MSRPLWDEALDRQIQAAHLFAGADGGNLIATLLNHHISDPYDPHDPDNEFAKVHSIELTHAATYAVTAEMLQVIDHGVKELATSDLMPLNLDARIPSRAGFVWLEKPQPFPIVSFDFLTGEPWPSGRTHNMVSGIYWVPTYSVSYMTEEGPKLGPGLLLGVITHRNDASENERRAELPTYVPFDLTAWAANIGWREVTDEYYHEHKDTEYGMMTASAGYWRRWMLAFWALCADHITISRPARATTRRAERALGKTKPPPNYGDVRVITLRRLTVKNDETTHGTVDWTQRWIVNGHFRWQACGEGRKEHRLIYIAPYVKGPEDKPLVIRQDVRVLKR